MKPLFRLAVGNPVLVHMVTVGVVVFGAFTLIEMPRELRFLCGTTTHHAADAQSGLALGQGGV